MLTNVKDYQLARNYWKVLKKRLKDEGAEPVTNCNQLKLKSADEKKPPNWTTFGRKKVGSVKKTCEASF